MWCKELTDWKRHWCWERMKAGGEGDDRGWDGWVASPTQWTWVCVDSGSWWWTGRPAYCGSWGCKESDTTEWLNWTIKAVQLEKKDFVFSITLEAFRVNHSLINSLINSPCIRWVFPKEFLSSVWFLCKDGLGWDFQQLCLKERSGCMSVWLLLFLQYTLWLKGEARCFKNKETTTSSALTYFLIT